MYKVSKKCETYRGCGHAWAAVRDGEVVALRYMDHHVPDYDVPDWVRAVMDNCNGLDRRGLPTCSGSRTFARVGVAAYACADCPKPPSASGRKEYRPSELVSQARDLISALESASFSRYRDRCRSELCNEGWVVSGMASCYELIPKYRDHLPSAKFDEGEQQ